MINKRILQEVPGQMAVRKKFGAFKKKIMLFSPQNTFPVNFLKVSVDTYIHLKDQNSSNTL